MPDLTVLRVVPILRIFSVDKAKEFYLDFLGFTLDWEHRFETDLPLYMQVSRGGLSLHLSEHHGDGCPGSTVFVEIRNVDDFQRELIAKQYSYLRPGVEPGPGSLRTMEVTDPFGNRIRFSERQPEKQS